MSYGTHMTESCHCYVMSILFGGRWCTEVMERVWADEAVSVVELCSWIT